MRFSLRWILAATAYVAAAAAAFTQTNWIYADILWALSLLAVVFALLLACFARGKRQVKAAGFVFAIAGFLLCLQFGGSDIVPTPRLLAVAGFGPPGSSAWWNANKSNAVFTPGSGYTVAGAEGYYDEAGRPLNVKLYPIGDYLGERQIENYRNCSL